MKVTILIMLLLLSFCAPAQPAPELWQMTRYQADSLRSIASHEKNDSLVMEACENLGFYYYESNYDSAIYFLRKDLTLAKKLSLRIWEADACVQLGTLFQYKGDITICYEYLAEAKALAEEEENENSNWHPWNFHNRNNFHDARIAIESDVYNGFGLFYTAINELRKSKAAYYKSIRLSQSINDNIGLGVIYMNIATLCRSDSALLFSKKALQYQDKAGYHRYRGSTLLTMAGAYYNIKQYDSATFFVYASIAEDEARNNLSSLSFSYTGLASYYNMLGKTDSVLFYAKKLMHIARLAQNSNIDLAAYKLLASLYHSAANIDSAYKYEQLSNHLNDSLKSDKIAQLTKYQTLAFNEQLRLKKLNDDKTAYQNNLKLYGVLGGLAASLIIAFVLYQNNRQKQHANGVLQTTLNNLKSTQAQLVQSEKMASLGELTAGIAHEIQNPLNFVNNFSEVNREMIDEATEEMVKGNYEEVSLILNDIKDNSEKINLHGRRADAIVKGMMLHSRQSKGTREDTSINSLCDEYLRLSYHGIRAKDKNFTVDFTTDFDKSIGNMNINPQDIGRVLLNLFNNAFYAVNEKKKLSAAAYKPWVSVVTKKKQDGIEIIVSDNGNGIPQNIIGKIFQPFFTTKPTGQGTGLGLSLSYDIITKEHNGTIQVESKEGEGTKFIITLPQ